VAVWMILTISATLGIVGLVGLFHECWTSARASAVSHGNEVHTQPLQHAPQNADRLPAAG
jgi:hypothetical protein